jgi:putative peptidoglycan lipid II flippase
VSWLYTAERLTELPLGLIGIAVATVILPSLSAKHAQKSNDEFKAMIDWALRVIVLVGVPASLAMLILAQPMIATLFHHGKFSRCMMYKCRLRRCKPYRVVFWRLC